MSDHFTIYMYVPLKVLDVVPVEYEEIQHTDICKKSIVGEWHLAPRGNKTKTSLSFVSPVALNS